MIEKDYIMRMIQQFARFLAAALFKIESGRVEEARLDIKSSCKDYLGLPFNFLLGIPDQELLKIFTLGGQLDVDRCYVGAQLLFCEAKARGTDRPGDSHGCYCRSLNLLLSCVRQLDDALRTKAVSTVSEILQELPDKDFPTEIFEKLLLFYEWRGEYARAEDCLFRLAENRADGALKTGESFYEQDRRILLRAIDGKNRSGA
jgi:hypothetical protein